MANTRKDDRAREMYRLYESGLSAAKIAAVFGCSRESVYSLFRRRGMVRRTKTFLPSIEYDGKKFTPNADGYMRMTTRHEKSNMLHRYVWEKINGKIKAGWDIHHKDRNPANNSIDNLECLPKSEHTKQYSPHNNQFTVGRERRTFPDKSCANCGGKMAPNRTRKHKETPSAFARRKCCSGPCGRAALRGKPKGSKI